VRITLAKLTGNHMKPVASFLQRHLRQQKQNARIDIPACI